MVFSNKKFNEGSMNYFNFISSNTMSVTYKVVKSTVKTWEIVYVNNILKILSSHKSWCELENESIYQQAHCVVMTWKMEVVCI